MGLNPGITIFPVSRLSECFEVDGCWKKVAICAEGAPREIKRESVRLEKGAAIGREHSRGVQGHAPPGKF